MPSQNFRGDLISALGDQRQMLLGGINYRFGGNQGSELETTGVLDQIDELNQLYKVLGNISPEMNQRSQTIRRNPYAVR